MSLTMPTPMPLTMSAWEIGHGLGEVIDIGRDWESGLSASARRSAQKLQTRGDAGLMTETPNRDLVRKLGPAVVSLELDDDHLERDPMQLVPGRVAHGSFYRLPAVLTRHHPG